MHVLFPLPAVLVFIEFSWHVQGLNRVVMSHRIIVVDNHCIVVSSVPVVMIVCFTYVELVVVPPHQLGCLYLQILCQLQKSIILPL